MADLRRDQERFRHADKAPGERRGRGPEEVPSSEELEEEKKKKKEKSKKKKKKALKLEPRKELKAVFGATGADPDPAIRRRVRKRAARLARRKTKESRGESTDSSESSSGISTDKAIFGNSSKVQTIGRKLPGALLTTALEEAEEAAEALLSQEGGVIDIEEGVLPPIFTKYFRQSLASKMSPAMGRESQTLAQMLDLGLRGRVVEAFDMAAQRLKALEMQSTGVHYSVAQQAELLPKETASMSTTTEFQKRAREEGRARWDASHPFGARGAGANRQEDWTKGGGKKGAPKGKGGKPEGKRGDQKKGDGEKAKGS